MRFFILILCLVFIGYELTKDYCFEQGRKLTDEEYILIVLEKLFKRDQEGRIKVHDRDNTADTYLLHHPNCCNVIRNDDGTQVIINYELSDKFKEIGRATHYTSLTFVSACGYRFKFYGGF